MGIVLSFDCESSIFVEILKFWCQIAKFSTSRSSHRSLFLVMENFWAKTTQQILVGGISLSFPAMASPTIKKNANFDRISSKIAPLNRPGSSDLQSPWFPGWTPPSAGVEVFHQGADIFRYLVLYDQGGYFAEPLGFWRQMAVASWGDLGGNGRSIWWFQGAGWHQKKQGKWRSSKELWHGVLAKCWNRIPSHGKNTSYFSIEIAMNLDSIW